MLWLSPLFFQVKYPCLLTWFNNQHLKFNLFKSKLLISHPPSFPISMSIPFFQIFSYSGWHHSISLTSFKTNSCFTLISSHLHNNPQRSHSHLSPESILHHFLPYHPSAKMILLDPIMSSFRGFPAWPGFFSGALTFLLPPLVQHTGYLVPRTWQGHYTSNCICCSLPGMLCPQYSHSLFGSSSHSSVTSSRPS